MTTKHNAKVGKGALNTESWEKRRIAYLIALIQCTVKMSTQHTTIEPQLRDIGSVAKEAW